jgi:hypothetical protein
MPLVSVTMQARNLPVDEAREPDVDDEAREADVVDGALDEDGLAPVADPHAVANRAMTPSATAFLIIVRTVNLLSGRPAGRLRATRDGLRPRRAPRQGMRTLIPA